MCSPCLPSASQLHILVHSSSHTERHQETLSSAPRESQGMLRHLLQLSIRTRLDNPHRQQLQYYWASSDFLHTCLKPGLPHSSEQLCSSMREKSKSFSVPRKGDAVLELTCSAPKLLMSRAGAQARVRAAGVFWGHHTPFARAGCLSSH